MGHGHDPLAAAERARLRALWVEAQYHLAEYSHSCRSDHTCRCYLGCVLTIDPCHERAHRLLMRSYARSGDRSAALRQYHTCAQALRAQLGTEPEADTVDLYEQLRLAPATLVS